MSDFLSKSFDKFKAKYGDAYLRSSISDGVGVYAYQIEKLSTRQLWFFCAKNSELPDDFVSIHAELVQEALKERLMILLWLKGTCWIVNPDKVLENRPWGNKFHGAIMLNFDLSRVDAITVDDWIGRVNQAKKEAEDAKQLALVPDQHPLIDVMGRELGAVKVSSMQSTRD